MKRMTGVLAAVVLATQGCGGTESKPESDPFASGEVVVQGEHVLDFSAFPDGGALVGDTFNLAFAITDVTPRIFAPESGSDRIQEPDTYLNYEKVRCDFPEVLEHNARWLERVHSANVDVVSVQVKPGSVANEGGFCFGYRTVGGGWTWELTPVALTLRPETGMLEVDLPVHKERVDAIKLVSTGRRAPVVAVRYTTF